MKAAAVDMPCRHQHSHALTHMHIHTHTQAHPPTVQTVGECNKAPLFLRSIKQNSKDLCESLRPCVWLKGRQRLFTRHSHIEQGTQRAQDTRHRTADKGQRTLSWHTDGTFIHLMSTPPLPSSTAWKWIYAQATLWCTCVSVCVCVCTCEASLL